MLKAGKLLIRILSYPKDFTYSELESLLLSFGYKDKQGAGSRVCFAKENHIIKLYKLHPENKLKRYQLAFIIKELTDKGLILKIAKMNNVLTYKGFIGSVQFSADDNVFFGKLEGINAFEGQTVQELNVAFCYMVDESIKDRNYLAMISQTTGTLNFHPGAGFINEAITLSFRKDGITKSYTGSTEASLGSFDRVYVWIPIPLELSNMLNESGQWDVLIEGKRWYLRTTIKGNLPTE